MLPGTLFLLAHLVTLLRGRGAEAPEASPDADTWAAAIEAAYQVDIERTPTLRAAWRAGKAAGRILVATEVLARLTSLRSGVPGARGPEAELLRLAGELHAEVAAFAGVLADVGLPVVTHHAGDVARLFAAHDLTAAIPGDGGALSYVAAKLPSFFEATARRFDVPPPRFAVAPPSAVEEDLLARIWADRSADGPRHAFAALAARRDDPRAEMIRLQFALADARYAGDRAALEVQARYLALSHPEWTDRSPIMTTIFINVLFASQVGHLASEIVLPESRRSPSKPTATAAAGP